MTTQHFRLYIRKHFTKGLLAGMTHDDSIPFVSRDRAAQWLRAVRWGVRAGKLDYRITATLNVPELY